MSKRFRFDDSGDSDELQALFDSIASEPAPTPPSDAVSEPDFSGDSPALEALFDQVAGEAHSASSPGPVCSSSAAVAASPAVVAATTAPANEHPHSCDTVFTKLGQMTRELHDALRGLGYDRALEEAVQKMPDARDRLNYVAQMTEQAASRVLNATDIAKPIQDHLEKDAQVLAGKWEKLFSAEIGVEEFKQLASDTHVFLKDIPQRTTATNAQLLEIMMAQDFQDLTGQVIKKIVEMAHDMEKRLLSVLIEAIPQEKRSATHEGLLNGPVINADGRTDVVNDQQQVDDLLESLGF